MAVACAVCVFEGDDCLVGAHAPCLCAVVVEEDAFEVDAVTKKVRVNHAELFPLRLSEDSFLPYCRNSRRAQTMYDMKVIRSSYDSVMFNTS